jgi:Glycosyltransferase
MADEPLDHPWFGPGQPPVLLAVGRFTQQKDFGTLIRASSRVLERGDARLLILGDGPERPHLEALVSTLGLNASVGLPAGSGIRTRTWSARPRSCSRPDGKASRPS